MAGYVPHPGPKPSDPKKPQESIVKTYTLPQVLEREPAAIAYATSAACWALVKNIGGSSVFIGYASGDVQTPEGPGTDVWQIDPSERDILFLVKGQKLFAASAGPAGRLTVHVFASVDAMMLF